MEANVGLFENDRQISFESTVALIEDVLVQLGHFLAECREQQPNAKVAWRIRRGSSETVIMLIDRDDFVHMVTEATVVTLNENVDERALYRHLLELNHDTIRGAAFSVSGRHIKLVSERSCLGLDRSEVLELVRCVRGYADDYDDLLASRFGASLGSGSESS